MQFQNTIVKQLYFTAYCATLKLGTLFATNMAQKCIGKNWGEEDEGGGEEGGML